MEVSRNALESVLDFVATDDSRECLKHVKVEPLDQIHASAYQTVVKMLEAKRARS